MVNTRVCRQTAIVAMIFLLIGGLTMTPAFADVAAQKKAAEMGQRRISALVPDT